MSRRSHSPGRTSVRHPRPSANRQRPERSADSLALARLPYAKGHLTELELDIFAALRGGLSEVEVAALDQVARTLRRPTKRLRALDLMRYWGHPLSADQQRMMPWLAGLGWHRPLPQRGEPLPPSELARHLVCVVPVPDFLLEPFVHPSRGWFPDVQWSLCRLLGVLGRGEGLDALREIEPFWGWVPRPVFEDFLQTPPHLSVLEGLIAAFVRAWSGPDWLPAQAVQWTRMHSLRFGLPPVLRVVQEISRAPIPEEEAPPVARERLKQLDHRSAIRCLFGVVAASGIRGRMPAELAGWRGQELRWPESFEALDEATGGALSYGFHDALRGRVAFWTLRNEGRHPLILRVDLERGVVRGLGLSNGARDPEGADVAARWAQANGLVLG